MTFGEKLKRLRKSKGLTPKAVAMDLHLTIQTYYQYESDMMTPSLKRCDKICDYYGIELEDLFKGVRML